MTNNVMCWADDLLRVVPVSCSRSTASGIIRLWCSEVTWWRRPWWLCSGRRRLFQQCGWTWFQVSYIHCLYFQVSAVRSDGDDVAGDKLKSAGCIEDFVEQKTISFLAWQTDRWICDVCVDPDVPNKVEIPSKISSFLQNAPRVLLYHSFCW